MVAEATRAALRPRHPAFRPFHQTRTPVRLTRVPDESVANKRAVHDESKTYKRSPQQFNSAEWDCTRGPSAVDRVARIASGSSFPHRLPQSAPGPHCRGTRVAKSS